MNSNTPAHAIKVFLVEDYAPVRERLGLLVRAVEGAGVVGEADDPAAAVSAIARTKPHVVVVDLRLKSGTSGLSVLRWLRANQPHVAAIVLSNSAYAQMKQACLDLGAWFVLDKTSEFAELGAAIATIAQQLGLIA